MHYCLQLCFLNIFFNAYPLHRYDDPIMQNQVPHILTLRKLTDNYHRYNSHVLFLEHCIAEGLIPRGLRVSFGLSGLPAVPDLRRKVGDILHNSSKAILSECKATYTYLRRDASEKLDAFLYNAFLSCDFLSFENTLERIRQVYDTSELPRGDVVRPSARQA